MNVVGSMMFSCSNELVHHSIVSDDGLSGIEEVSQELTVSTRIDKVNSTAGF